MFIFRNLAGFHVGFQPKLNVEYYIAFHIHRQIPVILSRPGSVTISSDDWRTKLLHIWTYLDSSTLTRKFVGERCEHFSETMWRTANSSPPQRKKWEAFIPAVY